MLVGDAHPRVVSARKDGDGQVEDVRRLQGLHFNQRGGEVVGEPRLRFVAHMRNDIQLRVLVAAEDADRRRDGNAASAVRAGHDDAFDVLDDVAARAHLDALRQRPERGTRLGGAVGDGDRHLRMLLAEAAQCYSRGHIGHKSKALTDRQSGNSPSVIA